MGDQFERHRSTRWVQAAPSYGDEWNDDYDDDNESVHPPNLNRAPSRQDSYIDNAKEGAREPAQAKNSGLVLSIDTMKTIDDSDLDDTPSSITFSSQPEPPATSDGKTSDKSVKVDVPDPDFVPPTPTFSTNNSFHGYSPQHSQTSEKSFVSDADSIQREPENLNLVSRSEPPAEPEAHSEARNDSAPVFDSVLDSEPVESIPEPAEPEPAEAEPAEAEPIEAQQEQTPSTHFEHAEAQPAQQEQTPSTHFEHAEPEPQQERTPSAYFEQVEAQQAPEPEPELEAPPQLVLSVDRMNLNDDDSSDDASGNFNFRGNDQTRSPTKSPSPPSLHKIQPPQDYSPEKESPAKPLQINHSAEKAPEQPQRRPIQTDALDSLIDDLQKMERSNTYTDRKVPPPLPTSRRPSVQRPSASQRPSISERLPMPIPERSSLLRKESIGPPLPTSERLPIRKTESHPVPPPPVPQKDSSPVRPKEEPRDDESEANLPSLGSIGDISLPDFENRTFDSSSFQPADQSSLNEKEEQQKQEEVQRAHESYLSSMLGHKESVRKPPTEKLSEKEADFTPRSEDYPPPDRDLSSTPKQDFSNALFGSEIVPVVSPESISTKHLSGDFHNMVPPNIPSFRDDLSRRDSTLTTSTFNMGNWKPNTNVYRDQFVNDNDNESQSNENAFNEEDEINYNNFTGIKSSAPGYEPSIASSNSVPATIALPSINENTSTDDTFEDSVESIQPPKKSFDGHASSVSVLKERDQETPTFVEESLTTAGSRDHAGSQESISTARTDQAKSRINDESTIGSEATGGKETAPNEEGTRNVSGASQESSEPKKKLKQKYPVFNWKAIMTISQPVDRISALQQAKQDEFDYDTGLQQWIQETLRSAEVTPTMQISKLAEEAYSNAQHTDLRRHASMLNTTSIRNKVSLMKDKMDTTAGFGRRFLNKGKKLMKQ